MRCRSGAGKGDPGAAIMGTDGRADRRRLFDVHTHAFPDAVAARALARLTGMAVWEPVRPTHDGTVAGLVASMDRAGIERAVVCSVATKADQVPKISEWSVRVASPRLVPFASIHPDFAHPEAEAERLAAAGVRGLKFHPEYMGCALDDPRCERIARSAARANLALAVHAGYDFAFEKEDLASPERVRRLHERVPDLRLLACHLGGWRRWEEALDEVAGLPIYLETSMTLGRCAPAVLERILRKHPPELLLFGTDAPWADQAAEVEKFFALPMAEEALRRAAWENAVRFVGE